MNLQTKTTHRDQMIEIKNIRAIKKGSLLASCDVYIKPWHIIFKEVKIFEKGTQRWIALPSTEKLDANGIKIYKEVIEFDAESVKARFKGQIMTAVDKFLEGNPGMETEDVITNCEDLPF
jgi:hypothetical protein